MESTQRERLNGYGAAGIGIVIGSFLISDLADLPAIAGVGALVAVALGAITLWQAKPGKELGFVAIMLALISLVSIVL